MRKLTLALLGASTALALCAGAGTAWAGPTATIYDALNQPDTSQPYSHSFHSSSGWEDIYNGSGGTVGPFFSGSVGIQWAGADVILQLTTNLPRNGDGAYGFADIFFDLNPDPYVANVAPHWDYGLDINSGKDGTTGTINANGFGQNENGTHVATGVGNGAAIGTLARLVKDPTYLTSVSGQISNTKICSDIGGDGTDCGTGTSGRAPEVEITNGSLNDLVFDVIKTDAVAPPPSYVYTITLAGVNTNGEWNSFRLFWATGWCGNDTVEGYAKVPVPAALPIFAAAMAGFGFAGWRRRKPAA